MEGIDSDSCGPVEDTRPALNILDHDRRRKSSWRSSLAALLRCTVVVAIAVAIRLHHAQPASEQQDRTSTDVWLDQVRSWFPAAAAVENSAVGVASVVDASGTTIGFAVTTLPAAKNVVGYRGPSDVLLLLDQQSVVVGAALLSSGDTPEHVEAVLQSKTFFDQFTGWTLGDPATQTAVDSVSGATLTSLAMAEAIAVRLGGEKPSLRFPDPLDAADVEQIGIADNEAQLDETSSFEAVVRGNTEVSTLIRTGPLVDSIAGYQGPSEVLLLLDSEGKTSKAMLRRTFDNQPYAGYLNDETYFWKVFLNKTLRQVSEIDLEAEQVEGVSGATMTSMAVAETIIAAAKERELRQQLPKVEPQQHTIRWGLHDVGTLLVLIGGSVIALTRLRGIRWLRYIWNVILVVYFGLVTGNLISLAVVFGWAARGVAWQLAPGLAAVVIVSFVLSVATRRNVYCSHICPHGAAQQLLRRRPRTNPQFRKLVNNLRWLPGVTLVAVVVVTLLRLNTNLAAWEPFNAYIWYVAGASSIVLAVASLLYSWFVPMGFCRHACGTGRLLDYIRRSAQSDRLALADAIAVLIAVAAWSSLVW